MAMREYGKVHVSFWTSGTIQRLTDDGKMLALYLLSCPHNNIIGAFRLPTAYACDDLGWDGERFRNAFRTLEQAGFAIFCRQSKWVCIVKFLDWNPPENPNQKKAAEKALAALPDTCFSEGLRNGSLTVTEQGTGTEAGTGTEEGAVGAAAPPSPRPSKRAKKPEQTFNAWADSLAGADAVPENDPVFDYAAKVGLPRDFVTLEWAWFVAKYGDGSGKAKRYADWRQTFRNAVEGRWGKLWDINRDGEFYLTAEGKQAQRAQA